jgi:hypothetical protein
LTENQLKKMLCTYWGGKLTKWDLGKDRAITLNAMKTTEVRDIALLSLNLGTIWMTGGLLDLGVYSCRKSYWYPGRDGPKGALLETKPHFLE